MAEPVKDLIKMINDMSGRFNLSQRQIGYILGVADTVAEKKAAREKEEQPA